jgi:hypothetical protein
MSRSGDLPTSALAAPDRAWDLAAFAPAGGLRASVPDLLRLAGVAVDSAEAAMGPGRFTWCWMVSQGEHGPVYWHNGATGASWAFIGASGSCAIAAAVPARRQRAWDTVAIQALSRYGAERDWRR